MPPWRETMRAPVTLVSLVLLLVARVSFAKRPVLLACRTLLALVGAAAVADLILGLRRGAPPVGALLAVVAAAALYPVAGRMALLFRASSADLAAALARSARMIRLGIEGGPRRYRLSSGETSATLAVFNRLGRMHVLVFGGSYTSKKTGLFRTVVAKQFGGLIPILVKVRA